MGADHEDGESMIADVIADARELSRAATGGTGGRAVLKTVLTNDSFPILLLWRLRRFALRFHVPLLNHLGRRVQTVVFGIEIGKDVTLGHGIYFVHPIGIVVGGRAALGDRVKLMGSNTIGAAREDVEEASPVLGSDVVVGCGARVLGDVHVGEGALIGANAVVLASVPARASAVGVPARVVSG
jgi:serine O-acetyltransferase